MNADELPTLLGLDRFPTRAHLAAVARSHRPLRDAPSVEASYAEHVTARWAELLGMAAEDLLLCGSGAEALRLLSGALLAPGDVALLAEPAPIGLPAAVLSVGGRYLDVGRSQRGTIPAAAMTTALSRHAGALFWAGSPSLTGADDTRALADDDATRPRATVVDGRLHGSLLGQGAPGQGALARAIALRDPDEPAAPLLHAVACAPGTGWALMAVRGPSQWPLVLLRRAMAALDTIAAAPEERTARHTRWLHAAHQRLERAIPQGPGRSLLPVAGHARAVRCLAGDGEEVAATLQRSGWSAAAFAAHPMQSLVIVDVAGSEAAIGAAG